MRKTRKRWVWLIVSAVIITVVGISIIKGMAEGDPIRSAVVTEGPVRSYVEERARTSLPHIYHITMPLQGRVMPISLEEGDTVEAGDIVIHLEDIDWQDNSRQVKDIVSAVENWVRAVGMQVKANQIRQDFTKWDWEKSEKLVKSSAVSERRERDAKRWYLDSTVKIEESQAMQQMSIAFQSMVGLLPSYVQRNLERTVITSPVSGTILKRHVWNEKVMTPGDPLLDIGNLEELEVTADILSESAVRIQPGDKVEIFGETVGNKSLTGSVRLVKPEAFTKISSLGVEEQRVAVKIVFSKGTIDALRKSGRSIGLQYQVRVRIITDAKKKAFLVPRTALFHGMKQQWQLYRVRNGKALLTDVEVGLMNDYTAEIVSGVQLGETVIIAPESSIGNGHKVTQME